MRLCCFPPVSLASACQRALIHNLLAAGEASKSGTGQHLPWNRLQNLEAYLDKQGIMEGVILVNGDKADFDVSAYKQTRTHPLLVSPGMSPSLGLPLGFPGLRKTHRALESRGCDEEHWRRR